MGGERADEVDARSGLTIHSLYRPSTQPPPDSLLQGVETIIFDLQDIGTRTWTYTGLMVYTLRAAARNTIPIVVLDRPNPITGSREEGPMLDAALAVSTNPEPGKPICLAAQGTTPVVVLPWKGSVWVSIS